MEPGYSVEQIDALLGDVRLDTNPLVLQHQQPHEQQRHADEMRSELQMEQNEPEEDTLSAFGDDEQHLDILNIVGTVEAFSVQHLNAIHAHIMGGHPSAGQIRTVDVNIIDRGGNVIYRPPPHSHVLQLMEDFCSNLNEAMKSVKKRQMEALAVAGWAHHQLVWVHPWTNANGRSSRVVMNSVLMRAGLNTLVLQPQARPNYDDFLQSANLGDIRAFINFIMFQYQSQDDRSPE